jgi:exodeoxyribonuclease VII large subunit
MLEITPNHNQFAYSVSEISQALKRVVEDNFGQVRVRGEISGWKQATSGHAYLKLKDSNAVLDAVCWKGVVGKMPFRAEDGMEVICTGKLTTYPGRSNYQLVIDFMEPAGVGALMALLEKRKAMLAAEGLFDASRKRQLPFMPQVIGVVTSPTGAVIRDILHRLNDRFPCHVLVWPVLVQGENAAEQIAAAIKGFNNLDPRSSPLIPRPDLLIVARGGGSLEDLWAFNEEIVVRAAVESRIPLISAVGHETDTTLIDYGSDRRAPTPTAAAEMAVPVREDWIVSVMEQGNIVFADMMRLLQQRSDIIIGLSRGLPHPRRTLDVLIQRLDEWSERLHTALPSLLIQKEQKLLLSCAKLEPSRLIDTISRLVKDITNLAEQLERLSERVIADKTLTLTHIIQLLESLNPTRILERGFVLVRNQQGHIITRATQVIQAESLELVFHDGVINATTN